MRLAVVDVWSSNVHVLFDLYSISDFCCSAFGVCLRRFLCSWNYCDCCAEIRKGQLKYGWTIIRIFTTPLFRPPKAYRRAGTVSCHL